MAFGIYTFGKTKYSSCEVKAEKKTFSCQRSNIIFFQIGMSLEDVTTIRAINISG